MYAREVSSFVRWSILVVGLILIFGVANHVVAAPFDFIDTDGDGLSDSEEINRYHTDHTTKDTDGDGYDDGTELRNGYSPHVGDRTRLSNNDLDNDGMNDFLELAFKTDLNNMDTDGDGYNDGVEVRANYDPRDASPKKMQKQIRVDLSDQKLRYYWEDIKMGEIVVSTGRAATPTPTGQYAVNTKIPSHLYQGATYFYPNTKWNLRFSGTPPRAFYIHGAYWHNNWGTPVSGGCVNVPYEYMEGLYHWADIGTQVIIEQ